MYEKCFYPSKKILMERHRLTETTNIDKLWYKTELFSLPTDERRKYFVRDLKWWNKIEASPLINIISKSVFYSYYNLKIDGFNQTAKKPVANYAFAVGLDEDYVSYCWLWRWRQSERVKRPLSDRRCNRCTNFSSFSGTGWAIKRLGNLPWVWSRL